MIEIGFDAKDEDLIVECLKAVEEENPALLMELYDRIRNTNASSTARLLGTWLEKILELK